MTGYRELARNHDFTVLWAGETISTMGSRMSMFVFPLLAYELSHSAMTASLVEGAFIVGLLCAMLPAGVLADRMNRKHLMQVSNGAGFGLYASLAVAGALRMLTVPHLLAVALLVGLASGIYSPAETSAVRTVVPDEQLPTAMSQNEARSHLAGLLGGPLGGALFGLVRWIPFAVDAVTYAIALVTVGRIRADLSPAPRQGERTRATQDLREGFAFVRTSAFLRTLTIWAALTNLVINALFFVATLRLLQAGFHPFTIGLVDAAAGVAGITGAALAPTIIERVATGHLTVAVAWSLLPLTVPMIFWNRPLVVALALGGALLLNPAGNAGIQAYQMAITPDRMQGRVDSAVGFSAMAMMPLAPILGGALLGRVGGPAAIAGLAAAAVVCALVVTLGRSVRCVPRPAVWRARPAGDVEPVTPAGVAPVAPGV